MSCPHERRRHPRARSTGTTGRRVARLARAAGHPVRAASRGGAVRFDWSAPDTWEPALVDADDIAAVAVAALTGDGHAGRTYEITGPRALPFGEAADVIARAADRPVRHLGRAEDYRHAMGLPAEQVEQEIAAFAALRDLGDGVPTDTVRLITGRDPRDFGAYAADAAARGAWRD